MPRGENQTPPITYDAVRLFDRTKAIVAGAALCALMQINEAIAVGRADRCIGPRIYGRLSRRCGMSGSGRPQPMPREITLAPASLSFASCHGAHTNERD